MTDHRFADEPPLAAGPGNSFSPNGFLAIPVAAVETPSVSPMQWLYQQMYEQALRVNQQPSTRDLFAIMN